MTLNPLPDFPATGSYVLKLHRDVQPHEGRLFGRVVHIVSGDSVDFASPAELLGWLCQHAQGGRPAAEPAPHHP